MKKTLEENKALEKLTLEAVGATLSREFCHHVLIGTRRSTYLSEMYLSFNPDNWDCPNDGRLVYVSHMFCDSIECSV